MTVQNNLTLVNACDASTGWAAFNIVGAVGTLQDVDTASEDMTVNVEGTQCLAFDCDKESGGYEYTISSTDLSKEHLYIWISIPTALGGLEDLVPASGQSGVFLTAKDSSGNRGYWHVAGGDTWDGAWKCFIAFLGDTPDTNSGSAPDVTDIVAVGFGVNHPNAKSKAACNIFFDVCRYGNDGVSAYGGSQGSELDFDHLVAQDAATAIGIVRKSGGIIFLNGPITFGHDNQDCYFKDTGQVVVFEDVPHLSGELFKFEVIEGVAQTTEFQLGNKSGTQGIQGCSILAVGDNDWNFYCSGEAVELLNLYGSTFGRSKWTRLSASGEKEVLSCSYNDQGSGEVYTNGIEFAYNNVVNPTNVGMVIDDDTYTLPHDSNFIACPVGIEFRASGEYIFSNLEFTNCTKDVWNNSGGTVTISATGTSNPQTTSGESITITNTKYHRVTGVKQGSEVTYVSGEGFTATVLEHEESVGVDGIAQYDYNYAGDFEVDLLIMHLEYEPYLQTIQLSSTDTIFPVSQVDERVYNNP